MKSNLEIAQEAELQPIDEIASRSASPEEVEPYGRYKAKITLSVLERLTDGPRARSSASRA